MVLYHRVLTEIYWRDKPYLNLCLPVCHTHLTSKRIAIIETWNTWTINSEKVDYTIEKKKYFVIYANIYCFVMLVTLYIEIISDGVWNFLYELYILYYIRFNVFQFFMLYEAISARQYNTYSNNCYYLNCIGL